MIERSHDTAFLNSIVNHPAVYPWVCGAQTTPLDMTALVEDAANILLRVKNGAFLCVKQGPSEYEVHTQFVPEGRGTACSAGRAGMDYMFTHTDCHALTTMVPQTNRSARLLALRCGFEFVKTEGTFVSHGDAVPMDHYALTRSRWAYLKVTRCL